MPDKWNEDFIKEIIMWKKNLEAAEADSGAHGARTFWRKKLDSVRSPQYLREAERRINEEFARNNPRQMSILAREEAVKQTLSQSASAPSPDEQTPAKASMTSSTGKPEEVKKKDDDDKKPPPPKPPTSGGSMAGFDESKFGRVKNPKHWSDTDREKAIFEGIMATKDIDSGGELPSPQVALGALGALGLAGLTAAQPETAPATLPALGRILASPMGRIIINQIMELKPTP